MLTNKKPEMAITNCQWNCVKGNIENKILRILFLLDFMKEIGFHIHVVVVETLGGNFSYSAYTYLLNRNDTALFSSRKIYSCDNGLLENQFLRLNNDVTTNFEHLNRFSFI